MSEDTGKSKHPTVESMVHKMFRYQQRQKYWQVAKFVFLAVLVVSVGLGVLRQVNQSFMSFTKGVSSKPKLIDREHISLVELRGPIWGSFDSTTSSTVDTIVPALRRAFKSAKTVAVILRINSPGGSSVQSDEIYNEIRYLRQKYPNIPIYAVCEEVCASGAYYIAAACNAIYSNAHTQIGSLGVIMADFGYGELMKKLGVERRLITAGDKKGLLDPYSPLKEEDVQIVKEMHAKVHRVFIDAVKQGRGERLKDLSKNEKELFSGRTWLGTQAIELGLIDGLGNADTIARELKVSIVDYTPQPDFFSQFRKMAGVKMSMLHQGLLTAKLVDPLLLGGVANF